MTVYSNVRMPSVDAVQPISTEALDLDALLSKSNEVDSEARSKEKHLRVMAARRMALQALSKAYPDHYRMLYLQAREQQDERRGPLPD